MAVNPCLPHTQKWRNRFQAVLNAVGKKQTMNMSPKYIRRIPKCVCTCDYDDEVDPVITDEDEHEVEELKSFFSNLSPDDKSKLGKGQTSIKEMLIDINAESKGMVLFLLIIKDAMHGTFDRLPDPKQRSSEGGAVSDWVQEDVVLPLSSTYAGLLIGHRGRNLAELRKNFSCHIHVKSVLPIMWSGTCAEDLTVTIRAKDAKNVEHVKELLMNSAKLIAAKRRKHEALVKSYRAWQKETMMKPKPRRSHHNKVSYGRVVFDVKDLNAEKYSRHSSSHSKDMKRSPPPVLAGSHCLHCLETYNVRKKRDSSSEEEMETEPLSASTCRFHPGYLVKDEIKEEDVTAHKWTCCEECMVGAVSEEMKKLSHQSSGCEEGLHLWRPDRKEHGHAKATRIFHDDLKGFV